MPISCHLPKDCRGAYKTIYLKLTDSVDFDKMTNASKARSLDIDWRVRGRSHVGHRRR